MATDLGRTGPPYPALPGPGSNAVGVGAIGQAQVGDIAPFDWRNTIISQYANSPIITAIIENFADAVDQTKNVSAFFDMVMNLDTAQGYGLDVWGRIVGVNRVLKITDSIWFGFKESLPGCDTWNDAGDPVYGPSLGFAEATDQQPFGYGTFGRHKSVPYPRGTGAPFYNGSSLTRNFALSDQTYRMLILAKAAANITDGSIPAINRILLGIFPNRGNCYVAEGQTITGSWFGFAESTTAQPFGQSSFYDGSVAITRMTMRYVFQFPLSSVEQAIVSQSGVLPRPTGVAASVVMTT